MAHRDAVHVDSLHLREDASRRVFLLTSLAGLALLAGCGSGAKTTQIELPDPAWPGPGAPAAPPPAPTGPSTMPGVRARSMWAAGAPVPSMMNRMLPVRHITVHHDGMTPFMFSDERSAAARIELVRKNHRERGWGDIGYHFIIDPAGRVWEGRHVSWQGAHVKDRNEGNIGIVCLGNFDRQSPPPAQIQSLTAHLKRVMQQYNVGVRNVKTHQEWAPTACPGRNLQRQMNSLRSGGRLA